MLKKNRLLAKLANADHVQGVSGAVASRQFKLPVEVKDMNIGDDFAFSSTSTPNFISCEAGKTGTTQQFAATVELDKKPNDEMKQHSPYSSFLLELDEILRYKWIESEKAGYDIGFEKALFDWSAKYRSLWQKEENLK